MTLDFSPLEHAAARLAEGLARHQGEPADAQLRDGLMQRFEFTYDLAPKMLRRQLEATADTPDVIDRMSFPELIRTGFEGGFLAQGWPAWETYRKMRNMTSHTYSEARARDVVAAIPDFLVEVRYLIERLAEAAKG